MSALGVRENAPQILLLLAVNAFVGATIGVERTVITTLGVEVFALKKALVVTSFIAAFGVTKAITNLVAGWLADRLGRRRVLLAGWLFGIPVPLLIMWAPSWGWVIFANALLGVNQGLCWTMTLFMKLDLGGPRRRGLTAGLNETIGYGCVALAAYAGVQISAAHGPRPWPFVLALAMAVIGTLVTALTLRDTNDHVASEHRGGAHAEPPPWGQIFTLVGRDLRLFAAVQAGFVRNLADGAAWGLLMLQFTGALGKVPAGNLQWIMIACFAIGQTLAGSLSDTHGRKRFVVAGMALLAAGFATVPVVDGFAAWAAAVALIGLGGSLMYPTVIGTIADQLPPLRRATGLGVYRFWRDLGYAAGALSSGWLADRFGPDTAIYSVAGACVASSLFAAYGLRPDGARLPAPAAAAASSAP